MTENTQTDLLAKSWDELIGTDIRKSFRRFTESTTLLSLDWPMKYELRDYLMKKYNICGDHPLIMRLEYPELRDQIQLWEVLRRRLPKICRFMSVEQLDKAMREPPQIAVHH